MKDFKLFSADSHLEISPERWTKRVPKKYRDRAPLNQFAGDGSWENAAFC